MSKILVGIVVYYVGSGVYFINYLGFIILICANFLFINNIFLKKKGYGLVSVYNLRDFWFVVKIICLE